MSLRSSKAELARTAVLSCVVALASSACETQVPATFPTASEHPDDDRRPDGIAVDLRSDPPSAAIEAETSDGVITLSTPLSSEVALTSVRAFFDSIETEDVSAMMRVVDSSALIHDTSVGTNRRVHGATSLWRQRFRKHEFHKLATRLIYRDNDVTRYRGSELDLLPLAVKDLTSGQPTSPTDVVLRVPIVTHTIKNQRVLGNELFFWLRRSGDTYLIYRIAEDIPL